ncbi:MAG: hypothetical protein PHG81_03015 [Aliarcobacter sp.]|nr:hypothetical protein [Aliarcobacter sp.]
MLINYKFNKTAVKILLGSFIIGNTLLNANTSNDFTLSENEQKVYGNMINEDLKALINSGKTIFSKIINFTVVSADTIQKDYEKNEIFADEKYKNKILIVDGKIKSINKDMFNNAYLSLYGGKNQFINPQAQFKNGHISWLSKLSSNQKVKIVCYSSRMIGGMAYLKDCIPSDVWIDDTTKEIIDNSEKLSKNENLNIKKMIDFVKLVTQKLPEKSSCFKDSSNSSCIKEIEKIFSSMKK